MSTETKLNRIEAIEKIEKELAKLKADYGRGAVHNLKERVDELNKLAEELGVMFSCSVDYIESSVYPVYEEDDDGDSSWDEDEDGSYG